MRRLPSSTLLRRPSLRVLILSASVALACSSVSGAAHAQSLFDVLFGRGAQFVPAPPPAPLYQPGYGYERAPARLSRPGREGERAGHGRPERAPKRVALRPSADEKSPKYTPPEVMPGPLGQFLRDPTLRRGDVVATSRGLMVFRGEGGSRHSERDFVPLSGAKNFAAGNRADLAALESALKRGHAPSHVGERLAAVEPPIVAQDEEAKR